MTMTIELTPTEEAQLFVVAREKSIPPEELVRNLVKDILPTNTPMLTPENDPTLALLQFWLTEVPTDPEAIRQAEEDLLEFKRNMNIPRKEAGSRLHYPEVEGNADANSSNRHPGCT